MPAPGDLIHQQSATTGTGNFTLATVNGKRSFNDEFGTGGTDKFDYYISNQGAAEWERGTGHLSASNTLVRDTVLASSNANAAVNFSAGTKDITNDIPAALQTRGIVWVRDYGATGDGSTDDTAAIQAAITANPGKTIHLGDGAFQCTGLAISNSYTKLTGNGPKRSVIRMTDASSAGVAIGAGTSGIEIGGFTLTRSATATAGGDGILQYGSVGQSRIHDLVIENQDVGLALSTTDFSILERVIVQRCRSIGVSMVPTNADGQLQWSIYSLLVQMCDSHGIIVQTPASGGPPQVTLGEWFDVESFANTGCGIAFAGSSSTPICDIRLNNWFSTSNGASNVYLDTYGTLNRIGIGTAELAGQSLTGSAMTTAATGVGCGVELTANNPEVFLTGVLADANSRSGIQTSATKTTIIGGACTDNGVALTSGHRNGILQIAGEVTIVGTRSSNNGAGTTQANGINLTTDNGVIVGCDLANNSSAAISSPVTLVNTVIQGVTPSTNNSFPNADGVKVRDSNSSNTLKITTSSNLTADRALTLVPGDADRTLTLNGNPTLDDWFNQSVKTTATPQFGGIAVSTATSATGTFSSSAAAAQAILQNSHGATNDTFDVATNFKNASGTIYQGTLFRTIQEDATAGSEDVSILYFTRSAGGSLARQIRYANGVEIGTVLSGAPGVGNLAVAGSVLTKAPVTLTGTSGTQGATDGSLIVNASGTFTLTLLAATSANTGRWLYVKSISAQAVNSASSNVVPIGSATAGTAILTATAGKWAILQSDGTNWVIMAAN